MQLLHYNTSKLEEKHAFLRQIGLAPDEIIRVIVGQPQLLSLDIKRNMRPKFQYLLNELGGSVGHVRTWPGYLTLSLSNRQASPRRSQTSCVLAFPAGC